MLADECDLAIGQGILDFKNQLSRPVQAQKAYMSFACAAWSACDPGNLSIDGMMKGLAPILFENVNDKFMHLAARMNIYFRINRVLPDGEMMQKIFPGVVDIQSMSKARPKYMLTFLESFMSEASASAEKSTLLT
eukprot:6765751-Karenia_brevis.AAC.1